MGLTIPYFRLSNLLQPQPVRSQIFKDTWGSACACVRCASTSGEGCDDSFYSVINTLQQKLHAGSEADFLLLASQLLQGGLVDMSEPWKANLTHLVLQDAIESRLQIGWITSAGNLLPLLEGLLAAFVSQKAIVGESKLLKPLCRTIIQLEVLHGQTGGPPLKDTVSVPLQQMHSLDRVLSVA